MATLLRINFFIQFEDIPQTLEAIRQVAHRKAALHPGHGRWQYIVEVVKATPADANEIFRAWNFAITLDTHGNITDLDTLDSDSFDHELALPLFKALAPWVREGSELEFMGDNNDEMGEHFRYLFSGSDSWYEPAEIRYPALGSIEPLHLGSTIPSLLHRVLVKELEFRYIDAFLEQKTLGQLPQYVATRVRSLAQDTTWSPRAERWCMAIGNIDAHFSLTSLWISAMKAGCFSLSLHAPGNLYWIEQVGDAMRISPIDQGLDTAESATSIWVLERHTTTVLVFQYQLES